jgi:hypothetical protein
MIYFEVRNVFNAPYLASANNISNSLRADLILLCSQPSFVA